MALVKQTVIHQIFPEKMHILVILEEQFLLILENKNLKSNPKNLIARTLSSEQAYNNQKSFKKNYDKQKYDRNAAKRVHSVPIVTLTESFDEFPQDKQELIETEPLNGNNELTKEEQSNESNIEIPVNHSNEELPTNSRRYFN